MSGFAICGHLKGLLASVNYIYSNSVYVLNHAQIIGHSTFGWKKISVLAERQKSVLTAVNFLLIPLSPNFFYLAKLECYTFFSRQSAMATFSGDFHSAQHFSADFFTAAKHIPQSETLKQT